MTLPRLPSLLALRAFEAAARLESFSRAAGELAVSQSAISHHIRQLEAQLGSSLFIRLTRAIALTEAGTALYTRTEAAFALLREGVDAVRSQGRQLLKVSLLPSFAAHWLIPRLPGFEADHPQIEIILQPSLELAQVGGGGVDLAIRYGHGDWPGLQRTRLLDEALSPVCSPAYLARHPNLSQLSSPHPLLCTGGRSPDEWQQWAAMAGFDLSACPRKSLSDYNIVLQAALAGQGLAMGRQHLIGDYLRDGRLIAPWPKLQLQQSFGYWLVQADTPASPALSLFCQWLLAQADPSI